MRGRLPRWSRRRLTTAQQYSALQVSALCPGTGRLYRNALQWGFEARPTPLGRSYAVVILYELGSTPEVFVVDPDLTVLASGRRLPHVYRQKPTRLCLYLPGTSEWSESLRIVDTIVPWAFLWLFYFEDWLDTNEWKGGGMHPVGHEEPDAPNTLH